MAVTPDKNPLNSFVSSSAGTNDIKLPPLPKLWEHIKESGFSEGIIKFDQAQEAWRQVLESNLNEQLQGKAGVPPGKL